MFIKIENTIINTDLITEITCGTEKDTCDYDNEEFERKFSFTIYFCAMSNDSYLSTSFSFYNDKGFDTEIKKGKEIYKKLIETLKPVVIG